jgi:hypothetical protein
VTVKRCRHAIHWGVIQHTRCIREADPVHTRHSGKGLSLFPDQRIEWFEGDRRSYLTDRNDEYSWTELPK